MDAWMNWRRKAGAAVVDMGMPPGNAVEVSNAGVANDESRVVGFSILEGESMEEIAPAPRRPPSAA